MLFLLTLLPDDLLNKLGVLMAIILAEFIREARAYTRGKRLRDVEKELAECLGNHKNRRPRVPKAAEKHHGTN